MRDRIDLICDVLLGAAYADDDFRDSEKGTIRKLLSELLPDGELPPGLAARIDHFDPAEFNVEETAAEFASESDENKQKLIELVAAVHDADDEFDFAEDDYLQAVAEGIGLGLLNLKGLTLDYEVENLREDLGILRGGPPPVPGTADVDIDIEI